MKRIILFILCILLLMWVFGVFSKNAPSATLGKPSEEMTPDGRDLFSLEEQKDEFSDFVLGGEYIVMVGQDSKTLRFTNYNGERAVFLNEQNKEESFSNKVLLVLNNEFEKKDVEDFFKKDKKVEDFEFFDSVGVASVTFKNPYTAYIKHLEYFENELFVSSELDFNVSTMQNVEIGI